MSVSKTRIALVGAIALLIAAGWFGCRLFRPLAVKPVPASFHSYDLAKGTFVPLEPPPEVFAIGLTYAKHIEETASDFDPGQPPPVFRKHPRAFARSGASVVMPDAKALAAAAEEQEQGLGGKLRERHPGAVALLDYEGELGIVLLETIDPEELAKPGFVPRIGFFVSNDLSARTLAILGEGRPDRYDYWGVSKSFPGFMPVGDRAWVPDRPVANGIPPVRIETRVNGVVRQQQAVVEMVYTPRQMLRFVHAAYPESPLRKGTMVLTGTPGGVALKNPRWQVRLANMAGMDRFRKLAVKLDGDTSTFLKPGDVVEVSAGPLGAVSVTIADAPAAPGTTGR